MRLLKARGWILVVSAVVLTAASLLLAQREETTYRAHSLYVVPSGAPTSGGPGDATDAQRLAATYAALIPNDDRIVGAVAAALGIDVDTVRGRMTVGNATATALLQVRYEGRSAAETETALAVLHDQLVVTPPPSITVGSLQLVRAAEAPDEHGASLALVVVGLLAGLAVGAGLIMVLERADPRVVSDDVVADLVRRPASELSELSTEGLMAVFLHLTEGREGRARVAVIPADRAARDRARQLADRVSREMEQFAQAVHGDVATARGTGGLTALAADVVVVVVLRGSRIAVVEDAVNELEALGAGPDWVFVANRRGRPVPGRPR